MAVDVEEYRRQTDRFLAEMDEELFLHYSGRKDDLALAPIYDRHADLTTLTSCRELAEQAAAGEPVGELWRFACEGYLGNLLKESEERSAELESTLEAEVAGARIPYRMLRAEMANEADRERRRKLDAARIDLAEAHFNPLLVEAFERGQEALADLGATTGVELYQRFGFELEPLAASCRALLEETRTLYENEFGALVERRLGLPLAEVERYDLTRLWRAPEWDEGFPSERMVPALEATLADLGIDLAAQRNIELDTEDRPNKSPRAFCCPIEVPGRVVLVIKPLGGLDDWRALFHEAGHAEHFAHTRAGLPVEARRLGDNAVTEGYAFLFEHLVDDPAWLRRRLDFGGIDELGREAAAVTLYAVRRYCAKLLYELELHGGADLAAMPERYRELLSGATGIEPSPTDYLLDVDGSFYVTSYLRAWAVEAQLSAFLAEQFGRAWFSRREAGTLLRELWYEGQAMTACELVREVTGQPLDLASVGERLRGRLA